MDFLLALAPLGRLLVSIKEYSFFDWKDLNEFMSEDEFLDYKAWYFTFYDELRGKDGTDVTFDALSIDSKIVHSNKADKAYIIGMLKHIGLLDNEEVKEKNINEVKREIKRTDNEQMRHKAPIMKDFINSRFANLGPAADFNEEYREFEKDALENSVVEFSKKHYIDTEFVRWWTNTLQIGKA